MRKTNILFMAITGLLLISVSAAAQKIWSLEDCINYAFENNIQIKQSQLNVESSKADYLQSKLNILPSLNVSANQNTSWGRSLDRSTYQYSNQKIGQFYGSVNSSISLFSGFQKINTVRQQEFAYLAQKYNSDNIRDNIALNIAAAYLQILYNIEQVKNAERQLQTSEDQVNMTKKEVEVGTVAKGSLLDVEAQAASDKVKLVSAQNQLMLAYLDLMQMLDLKASTKFDIVKPDLQITRKPSLLPVENIYNKAVTIMPEIKYAEYYVKSADRSLAIAKGSRSPSLSLSSSYGNNYSNQITNQDGSLKPFWDQLKDNGSINLGFSLSIPIFNGFQTETAIKKSKINLQNAQLNLVAQKNTLRKNIEQAYTDALASYQTYVADMKSVASLEEAFKYAQEKFNVGMLSATDYNVSKNNYYNALSTLTSAKYDYIFKTKILDFYLGKSLDLNDMGVVKQ
ncbi:MAG: TolC family protein [Bacteroidales bacterium]|nr:TolC family protein [Bacteroidales bacterium]